MKRNKAQLNAISRSYSLKRYHQQVELLMKYNLEETFNQSKYKSMTWFITWAVRENLIPREETFRIV